MGFVVRQEKFEGPLELLLELIEKEKLSISEISLAKVTDDYLAHVKALEAIDPEALAEFLVVAAQLMLVKSRTLLPSLQFSEEEEASLEELEARLAEYQRMRTAAQGLAALAARKAYIQTREAWATMDPIFYPPPKFGAPMLAAAFESFLASIPKAEKLVEEKIRKVISLEEKMTHIRSFLENVTARAFSQLVSGAREKVEVIVSFLAILELAKQKFLTLDQKELFADIEIKRAGGGAAAV